MWPYPVTTGLFPVQQNDFIRIMFTSFEGVPRDVKVNTYAAPAIGPGTKIPAPALTGIYTIPANGTFSVEAQNTVGDTNYEVDAQISDNDVHMSVAVFDAAHNVRFLIEPDDLVPQRPQTCGC